jgi:uncharacterized protein
MKTIVVALSGALFAVGLLLSGMTIPANVTAFLDVLGAWSPQLMAVMAGAIVVHGLLYPLLLKQPKPMFAERFDIPTNTKVDPRLVVGAVVFGVGWGLSGLCPGPALVVVAADIIRGHFDILLFVAMMLAGMRLAAFVQPGAVKS